MPISDLIQPAPDAVEYRIYGPGERLDPQTGIFFLETATGRVTGYVVDIGFRGRFTTSPDGTLILYRDALGFTTWLLDRRRHAVWQWPRDLRITLLSNEWLLIRQSDAYRVVDRAFAERAAFALPPGERLSAVFSPDGRHLAYVRSGVVHLLDIEANRSRVFFEWSPEHAGGVERMAVEPLRLGAELLVSGWFGHPGADGAVEWRRETRRLDWRGTELPWDRHWASLSPDGRYATGPDPQWGPGGIWPSLVVADAETGDPLFRARSAYGLSRWLSTSDGLLVEYRRDAGAPETVGILRTPGGHIEGLPAPPQAVRPLHHPAPAPGGGGRYVSFGSGWHGAAVQLYDAHADDWTVVEIAGWEAENWAGHHSLAPWGEDHRELRFAVVPIPAIGVGSLPPFLAPLEVDLPPFTDSRAFRVAGTGSCLNLRAAPGRTATVARCMSDGTRVMLQGVEILGDHGDEWWAAVRTDDGAEGWVAPEYLEHE